jgi:probable HAF family extracellular repeat protein
MYQHPRIRTTLLAAAGLLALSQAWAEPVYTVGTLPMPVVPSSETYGAAINNTGKTGAEMYQTGGGISSYRCGASSCKQIRPLDVGQHHSGNSINGIDDAGNVVGTSPYLYFGRAFLFDGKTSHNIGFNDGPDLESTGEGINNVGMLVGSTETLDHHTRAFVWDNGTPKRLGTLGGNDSWGLAINDHGDVAGWAQLANGEKHAFLQRAGAGTMRDLGTLGGNESEARGVNQSRQVVGCSKTAGNASEEAFIYAGGLMQGLPTLGGTSACAYAINKAGWVVGQSSRTPGVFDFHAFVFDGEKVYDLNDVLSADHKGKWLITQARGINKKGQIIGTGKNLVDGKVQAVVLTPVAP